jgi:hypothetical protein
MSNRIANTAFAMLLMVGTGLMAAPGFAAEPDVDSPAGPENPAPRTDRPDFQLDDQAGAAIDPQAEGADPTPPESIPPLVLTDPGAPILD